MTKIRISFAGIFVASSLVLLAPGCGEDKPASSTGGEGGSAGAGGGGGGSGGGMVALTCEKYCGDIQTNCTAANAQYTDNATCLAVCATFAMGTSGESSGDTLACRQYHVGAAANAPDMHCAHAGPGGGTVCGMTLCEAFCNIATDVCNTEWPDVTACSTACTGWATGGGAYNTSDTNKNTFECRLYHLSAAAVDPALHCAHTVTSSPVCAM